MKIIFTIGDSNGIGLEVFIKAVLKFDNANKKFNNDFFLAGNKRTIAEYISHFNINAKLVNDNLIIGEGLINPKRICQIINCKNYSPVDFGKETQSSGLLAAEAIEFAVRETLKGNYDAIVTMPVSKSVLYKAGWKFPGHTEMLADRCKTTEPLMILCADKVRVGLATIHIPLKDVPSGVTKKSIYDITEKFFNSLIQDFGILNPQIAILGLNPHSGEDGSLGNEEIEIIKPTIFELNSNGINVNGPFPADGFFAHGAYKNYDGILAMYHDQGLIPLKLLADGGGVNFTAGLPIIRTSPDHGTAFGIAGKGIADEKSSLQALKLALNIINSRKSSFFSKIN